MGGTDCLSVLNTVPLLHLQTDLESLPISSPHEFGA